MKINNMILLDKIFLNCFLCFFIFSLISCNNIDYNFNKLISIEEKNNENIFYSINLHGIENINNVYYKRLYKKGKNINKYLIEKMYSEKMTNWYNYPFYIKMSEGDIAVNLLLDINEIEFNKIIPMEILNEYNKNGARILWNYLHENKENIIELIIENI